MRNWKAAVAGGIVAGAAILCAGMATQEDGKNAVLVEEVYVVRPGDTIWGIAEEFCEKNTGTRRYILEYKSGMEELNPWLLERHGMIYPGDKLTLTYWVKSEEAAK
ncbi:LysM peptidoglycan-binding domain-containing protein [Selenomonas felix]|uniref:LysM peptidoglycan-binding domain-containing protein n=1 Tax=Selenomonas felix TaxID=1944634 RepID=UPI0023571112|nr:LysM domain-containing protein [Selenomonas felix]